MISLPRYSARHKTGLTALFLLAALACAAAQRADKNKKEQPEKKEKIEPWVEVRTTHFIVASDGGEGTARRIAREFEQLLHVFQSTMPNCRVSTGIPARILASRDGQSFGRMLPEYPYDKRHEQPDGVFVSGSEKTYVAIRANASGRFPYDDIFKEYARIVLRLSYRNLPPWLEEGFSNVYGNLTFTDRGARLERPDPDDLSILFESPLLPLDIVMNVDHTSGYYSSGNRSTVFFAESRVLVNFLISDPQISASKSLERYVAAVEGGADSLQAARQAFGDLNQLQSKLQAFAKQTNGPPADLPVSGGSDTGGPARMLSPAEAEARMGDFLAARGKDADAQDELQAALRADPSLAEAEQSLGYIMLRKEELDEAKKYFERAAQLDPKDALTYYGLAGVALLQGANASPPDLALVSFEKTVSLNPDFAPAWYGLGALYSKHNETLPKALADVQRAASLEPGDAEYQLEVADLLNRMGRSEEARKLATHVEQSTGDQQTANKAGDLLARMSPSQPASGSTSTSAPAEKQASNSSLRIERKTEPEEKQSASSASASKTDSSAAPIPPLFEEAREYSMVGTIAEVNCSNAPQVQLTLKAQSLIMKLHADDLARVLLKSAGSAAAAKGVSCTSLRGRAAHITYLLAADKPWDGEIRSVEFRSQP